MFDPLKAVEFNPSEAVEVEGFDAASAVEFNPLEAEEYIEPEKSSPAEPIGKSAFDKFGTTVTLDNFEPLEAVPVDVSATPGKKRKYTDFRGEIRETPKRGILSEAVTGLERGAKNIGQLATGSAALAADIVGADDVAEALLKQYISDEANIPEGTVGTFSQAETLGDYGRWAVEKITENLPMFIPSLVSGGAGAVIARRAAQRGVEKTIEKLAEKMGREAAEKTVAQTIAKKTAMGAAAGAAPTSVGMEASSIYGDTYQESGVRAPGTAVVGGILAGSLDILPQVRALNKAFGPAVTNKIKSSILKRFGKEMAVQMLGEGSTESAQTAIENAARLIGQGKELEAEKVLEGTGEAFLAGMVASAPMSVTSQAIQEARSTPEEELAIPEGELKAEPVQTETVAIPPGELEAKSVAKSKRGRKPKAAPVVETPAGEAPRAPTPTPETITDQQFLALSDAEQETVIDQAPARIAARLMLLTKPEQAEEFDADTAEPAEPDQPEAKAGPAPTIQLPGAKTPSLAELQFTPRQFVDQWYAKRMAPVPLKELPQADQKAVAEAIQEKKTERDMDSAVQEAGIETPAKPEPDQAPPPVAIKTPKIRKKAQSPEVKAPEIAPIIEPVVEKPTPETVIEKTPEPANEPAAPTVTPASEKVTESAPPVPAVEQAQPVEKPLPASPAVSPANKAKSRLIEQAFANLTRWEPAKLAQALRSHAELTKTMGNKAVDPLAKKAKAIESRLTKDGFDRSGNPITPEAYGEIEFEKDDPIRVAKQREIATLNEKARKRVEKNKGEEDEMSDGEYSDWLKSIGRPPRLIKSDLAAPKAQEKAPESVKEITTAVMSQYFGGDVDGITIETSDTRENGEAWGDANAEISIDERGRGHVRVNPTINSSAKRKAIVHEVVSHFGISQAIKVNSPVYRTLLKMYTEDQNFAAANPQPATQDKASKEYRDWHARAGVFSTYAEDYTAWAKQGGDRLAEANMFDEWIARQVEAYDARESGRSILVVQQLRSFFKRLLAKMGLADARTVDVDQAIRDALKVMRDKRAPKQAKPGVRASKAETDDFMSQMETEARAMLEAPEPIQEPLKEAAEKSFSDAGYIRDTWDAKFRRGFADEFDFLQLAQKEVEKQTGKKLTEDQDAYLKQQLLPGSTEYDLREFRNKLAEPLLEVIRNSGLKMNEINRFLLALHTPEANKRFVEANTVKETDTDAEAVKKEENLRTKSGAGMSNNWAMTVLEEFAKDEAKFKKLTEVAKQVKKIVKWREDYLVSTGMMTKKDLAGWRKMYRNYIPLRGWLPSDLAALGLSEADITRLREKGMTPETEKILRNRGITDESIKALKEDDTLNLTDEMIKDLEAEADANEGFIERMRDIEEGGGDKTVGLSVRKKLPGRKGRKTAPNIETILPHLMASTERLIQRSNKNQVGLALLKMARENPNKKFWEELSVAQYQARKNIIDDSVLQVVENGKQRYVYLKDPRLAVAFKKLGTNDMGFFLTKVSQLTRGYSSLLTTLNPSFWITNFQRDIQAATVRAGVKDGGKVAASMLKNLPSAAVGMAHYLGSNKAEQLAGWVTKKTGAKDIKTPEAVKEWGGWAERFAAAGGRVAFPNMQTIQGAFTRLQQATGERTTAQKAGDYGKKMTGVLDFIRAANDVIEGSTRLAYFRALVESGVSEKRAAAAAKTLTVNFNQRGEYGKWLSAMWLFWNANVQGARVVINTMASKKGAAAASALITAGYFSAMIADALSDRDDEGRSEYEKESAFSKTHNWIIPGPNGKFLRIPMPYGFNVFPGLGAMIYNVQRGYIEQGEAASELGLATAQSFNPFGTLLPSIANVVYAPMIGNRDYQDRPIAKERSIYKENIPRSEMGSTRAHPGIVRLTQALNRAAGGDEYSPGRIIGKDVSINPDALQYLMVSSFGGLGDIARRGAQYSIAKSRGENPEITSLPFLNKPFLEKNKRFYETEFYQARERMKRLSDRMGAMADDAQEAGRIQDRPEWWQRFVKARAQIIDGTSLLAVDNQLTQSAAEERKAFSQAMALESIGADETKIRSAWKKYQDINAKQDGLYKKFYKLYLANRKTYEMEPVNAK